jgi:predicted NAD/FAD-binding protein
MESKKRVAVIGGGVAGIVTAHLLQKKHAVTLFEKNDYLGGHTHTIEIPDGPDAGLAVDTGFIVLNNRTYPNFETFLERLGIKTRISEMSFALDCQKSGLVYGGSNLNGLFAQRRNLVNTRFISFLFEIAQFCRQAQLDLETDSVGQMTLQAYLARHQFSDYLTDNYLAPMAAAIWSTPLAQIADFPARPFLDFFRNHGLLSLRNRPIWKTVVGGSHAYVKRFQQLFNGEVRLSAGVEAVQRNDDSIKLRLSSGQNEHFDRLVIATHADQALRLLADPDSAEQELLSPWKYQKNRVVLHTDASVLPPIKRAWCAWNFRREVSNGTERPVFVTYYMNRLQGLKSDRHYCVTLNRENSFDPKTVIAEMDYHHPLYTEASMATQSRLAQLNSRRQTWFCGSYFGYGFHEDAVSAAVAVGHSMGIEL